MSDYKVYVKKKGVLIDTGYEVMSTRDVEPLLPELKAHYGKRGTLILKR